MKRLHQTLHHNSQTLKTLVQFAIKRTMIHHLHSNSKSDSYKYRRSQKHFSFCLRFNFRKCVRQALHTGLPPKESFVYVFPAEQVRQTRRSGHVWLWFWGQCPQFPRRIMPSFVSYTFPYFLYIKKIAWQSWPYC